MNILVACECSGVVRDAFLQKGHNAWSCDIQPADDGGLFHYCGDALKIIKENPWDLIIAHPPCTHLAVSGARWFKEKRADGRQQEGIKLFMSFVNACDESGAKWAIENPIGIMSSLYRKPSQIIQPWQHGHGETKATCLWLGNGLDKLQPSNVVSGRESRIHKMAPSPDRGKLRSVTYVGIAKAMSEQWDKMENEK